MELKDVILSTLAELEDIQPVLNVSKSIEIEPKKIDFESKKVEFVTETVVAKDVYGLGDEKQFLESIQERLLVLFEGFQAPNNIKVEAKVDLTLNFLEYLLASIESRMNLIDNKEKA
jgi:hypothetical protein